jgi:signal transduction histidine kinase
VVSDAVASAIKHSHACEVAIQLVQRGGALLIDVSDDGIGGAHLNGVWGSWDR